jgi:hypothetical protein
MVLVKGDSERAGDGAREGLMLRNKLIKQIIKLIENVEGRRARAALTVAASEAKL